MKLKILSCFSSIILLFNVQLCAQNISTAEDRAALFDYILEKTMQREAFAPQKKKPGEIEREMLAMKAEIVNASTDEELFYALRKLSNIRQDRHLSVSAVDDGLQIRNQERLQAPISFFTDFGKKDDYFLFVSDYASNISEYAPEATIEIGDKLITFNGLAIGTFIKKAKPYQRHSTELNFWRRFPFYFTQKSTLWPADFYGDKFEVELEKKNGTRYKLSLPYLKAEDISWTAKKDTYPGFKLALKKQTYHLYLPKDPNQKTLLLWWYGFREDLVKDMDFLVDYAEEHKMLDWDIIIDATGSRGGSRGAYAIQRLSPKSFKTTFGNLKLSDITLDFIHDMNKSYVRKSINDGGVPESVDGDKWKMDWLNNDVISALAAGQDYTANVPFKSAHLPKYSDGILKPAKKHFTGQLVCFMGSWGGSHLDQFAAMIRDNDLGYVVGMPAGGYSNTWEWEETLVFPISKKPVVEYMWSIGHTIRPNGAILEGNPATVNEYIPVTRENYQNYIPLLLEKAKALLTQKKP